MKLITLPIFVLLLLSCKEDVKERPEKNAFDAYADVEQNQEAQEVEERSPQELFRLAKSPEPYTQVTIIRADSSFSLPLRKGVKTFKSYGVESVEGVDFEFHGINKQNDFYIVEGHYWEWYEFYLVSRKTGSVDTIWTRPIFSPNNLLLISKSTDYGLEGHPNGYQIWQLNQQNRWTKVYEIDQQDWVPLDFRWISDGTFILKKAKMGDYLVHSSNIEPFVTYEKITIHEL